MLLVRNLNLGTCFRYVRISNTSKSCRQKGIFTLTADSDLKKSRFAYITDQIPLYNFYESFITGPCAKLSQATNIQRISLDLLGLHATPIDSNFFWFISNVTHTFPKLKKLTIFTDHYDYVAWADNTWDEWGEPVSTSRILAFLIKEVNLLVGERGRLEDMRIWNPGVLHSYSECWVWKARRGTTLGQSHEKRCPKIDRNLRRICEELPSFWNPT